MKDSTFTALVATATLVAGTAFLGAMVYACGVMLTVAA